MAIVVRDPAGREWRVWRKWIEAGRIRRWRNPVNVGDALQFVDVPDLGIDVGEGILGLVAAIVVAVVVLIVLAVLLVAVFEVLIVAIPLVIVGVAAVAGLCGRLLRLAPFSVEAQSGSEHVRYPVHGIRASRRAMDKLASAIAAGAGPRLDGGPVLRPSLD